MHLTSSVESVWHWTKVHWSLQLWSVSTHLAASCSLLEARVQHWLSCSRRLAAAGLRGTLWLSSLSTSRSAERPLTSSCSLWKQTRHTHRGQGELHRCPLRDLHLSQSWMEIWVNEHRRDVCFWVLLTPSNTLANPTDIPLWFGLGLDWSCVLALTTTLIHSSHKLFHILY